ncbi:MAG: branched-chain amino acid ABC transporter permease [Candidatus Caldarchaeales archaeon]
MSLFEIALTNFLSSLLLAGLYALAAYGLTLIYGVMKIVDVSQGALITLGAYLAYALYSHSGVDPLVSPLVAFPLFFAYGYFVQSGIARRALRGYRGGQVMEFTLLLFFGLLLAITGLVYLIWTGNIRAVATPYVTSAVEVLGVRLQVSRLFIFVYAMVITALLWFLLSKTDMGRAIRAVSQDADAARTCGIRVSRVFSVVFGIVCGLSATAGSLMPAALAIHPAMGIEFITISIVITIIGGMGNFIGALIGAVIYSGLHTLSILTVGPAYAIAIALAFMMVVLLFRPTGILGERVRI